MKTKRLWAILLSLVMTVSMIPSTALAVETTEETEEISEAVTEEAVEEETAEDAEETTVTKEAEGETSDDAAETVSDEKEETEEEADEEADVPGESGEDETPAEPENAEETADEDLQEGSAAEDETEPEMPAQTFEGKVGDIEVSVVAEAGAFLPGTEMELTEVKAEDIAEAVADAAGESATIVAAVDITFKNKGIEVEPGKPISVSLKTGEMIDAEKTALVHVDNEGAAEIVEEEQIEEILEDGIAFISDAFSIYAVVHDDVVLPESRLTVNFWKESGDAEPLATMYVKTSDLSDDDLLAQILYDPGVGALATGLFFDGWSVNKADFDENSESSTIDNIRQYLKDEEAAGRHIKEGDELNIYARIFRVYEVKYLDPDGIGLYADQVIWPNSQDAQNPSYTIGHTYQVTDTVHQFEGWQTPNAGNISNPNPQPTTYTEEGATKQYYTEGTTMTLTGDVTFTAYSPLGHYLVFNEVLPGATYNAPKFYKEGEKTSAPTPAPTCTGYQFDGWYTGSIDYDASGNFDYPEDVHYDNSPFQFGTALSENTELIAKWNIGTSAPYTVIIWTEDLDETYAQVQATGYQKKYQFYKSYTLNGNPSAASVTAVESNNNSKVTDGNGAQWSNARVMNANGNNQHETVAIHGYHCADFDGAKKIEPNGSTVFNVYYDRNVVKYQFKTITFDYGSTIALKRGWYAKHTDGKYYRIYTAWGTTPLVRVNPSLGLYYIYPNGQRTRAEGIGYYRTGVHENVYKEQGVSFDQTGLYGEPLRWPTNNDYWWYEGYDNEYEPSGTRMTYMDAFLPLDANMNITYYGDTDSAGGAIYFYLQDPDEGNTYHLVQRISASGGEYSINDKFTGYEAYAYYYGSTDKYNSDTVTLNTSASDIHTVGIKDQNSGIYDANPDNGSESIDNIPGNTENQPNRSDYKAIFYKNSEPSITFRNGRFVNGREVPISKPNGAVDVLHTETAPYGSDISDYNIPTGDKYYEPENPGTGVVGYTFAGWYKDDACTEEYEFTTMPASGVTVYAKWYLNQYRVFLYTNVPTEDTSLFWGSEGQQMNFRVDFGGKVSTPMGTRNNYEMVGWFTDQAFTNAYIPNMVLNDSTVTTEYTKVEQTDPNGGKFGLPYGTEGTNADVNRRWITKKLELFCKWIEKLPGAEGIGILYDPNVAEGGDPDWTPGNTGTALFKDGAEAVAGSASNPNSDQKRFAYWEVQRYNGQSFEGTGEYVYPGDSFVVRKEYAQVTDSAETPGLKYYNMQLIAHYIDLEGPKPTHITWYANNGTGDTYTDEDLKINEKVTLETAIEKGFDARPGYKFIGWAKMKEADADDINETEAKMVDLTEADCFVKYNEAATDSNKKYSAEIDNEWTEVKSIAADENDPYEAMVAVWSAQYYIYHIGSNGVEAIKGNDRKSVNPDTITPSELCTPGFLYGGYYVDNLITPKGSGNQSYKAGIAPVNATDTTKYTDGNVFKGKDAYDGTNWKFNYEEMAGPENQSYTPQPGDVIYIKEVPASYLRIKYHVTYSYMHSPGQIKGIWYLTDADGTVGEDYYQEIGIRVSDGYTPEALSHGVNHRSAKYDTLKVKKGETDLDPRYTKDIFASLGIKGGVFGAMDAGADFYGTPGQSKTLLGYWITKDGVTVYGTRTSTITTGSSDPTIYSELTTKARNNEWVPSSLDSDPDTTTIPDGGGVLYINATENPAVKKIVNGEEYIQYVDAGDCTGKIESVDVEGKTFAGWYTDPFFKEAADFSNVSADMEVYGKYIKASSVKMTLSAGSVVGGKVTLIQKSIVPKGSYAEAGAICKVGDKEIKVEGTPSTLLSTTYTAKCPLTGMRNGTKFTVTPYFVTNDGTVIYGSTSNCTVNRLKINIE